MEAAMKDQKVYITRMIPDSAVRLLEGQCSVEVNPENRPCQAKVKMSYFYQNENVRF